MTCHSRVSVTGSSLNSNIFDQDTEQALAEMPRQPELVAAPFRAEPRAGNQKKYRFTTISRVPKRLLPAFAGLDAAFRIEIEEDIVPALLLKPASNGESLRVVFT